MNENEDLFHEYMLHKNTFSLVVVHYNVLINDMRKELHKLAPQF
jgi:hypothetical protein